jgi:hypothetical protein
MSDLVLVSRTTGCLSAPESQNAAKKPHNMRKSAEKFGGFPHVKYKNYILSFILSLLKNWLLFCAE